MSVSTGGGSPPASRVSPQTAAVQPPASLFLLPLHILLILHGLAQGLLFLEAPPDFSSCPCTSTQLSVAHVWLCPAPGNSLSVWPLGPSLVYPDPWLGVHGLGGPTLLLPKPLPDPGEVPPCHPVLPVWCPGSELPLRAGKLVRQVKHHPHVVLLGPFGERSQEQLWHHCSVSPPCPAATSINPTYPPLIPGIRAAASATQGHAARWGHNPPHTQGDRDGGLGSQLPGLS